MTDSSGEAQGFLFSSEECGVAKEPVIISACLLGIPCRWHGRRASRRDALLERLKRRYVLVPLCPEQLGGMPTPRTSESLAQATGTDILDGKARLIAPETGQDVTEFHIVGARYTLELAQIIGAHKAYLKSGSPSCDRNGVTGETLRRAGIEVFAIG
ncbi:MAG: DUF523 domain-containing protein [Candidatus Abyssobacteria bacterium SURF_5]|uniref:DUF523 domain-containing protein n=1 Tax=Abyssobacteria bacterium (strain SURF_5) TaxID=2093360 RepID=A0A3A4NGI9_ABYX5|nr:MAG: DUF523 domain-containing protein [Candidatus Abyssubacteria bacterium SURF_5]